MVGVVCLVAMSREAVGVFTDTYISEIAGKDAIVCGDLGVRGPESGVGEYGFVGAGQIPTQGLPVAAREQAHPKHVVPLPRGRLSAEITL